MVWETMLIHKSGEWISGYLPIKPKVDDPQGMGSAITYARRYALSAMLGIVADDDDDAEIAQARKEPPKSVSKQSPKPVQRVSSPPKENSTLELRKAYVTTSCKKLGWGSKNTASYLASKFNMAEGKTVSAMLPLLTDEQYNEFNNELEDRLSML